MLLAPAYHAPDTKICLLSPQQYFQHAGVGSLYVEKDHCTLTTVKNNSVKELMSPYKFDGDDALQPAILCTKHQTTHYCTALQCKSYFIAN
eukprot:8688137-Ditylum_brightwellii.AAC.1